MYGAGNVSFAAEAGTMTAAKAETKTGIGAGTLEHVAGVFEGQEINSEYSFLNSADNTDEMLARPRMECRFYIPDVGDQRCIVQCDRYDLRGEAALWRCRG